jgi:probable HAF family extracellular repeat protein
MPVWVGPQAPCVNAPAGTYNLFTAANAASQGTSNADGAVAAMAGLGLSGTVIFYDMESYTAAVGSSCSNAVRAFLNAWVSEMNANSFATTAIYGNPGPAEQDFSTIAGLSQVWITVTPNPENGSTPGGPPRVTTWGLGSGSSALQDTLWANDQRAHQFLINISSVVYGSYTSPNPTDYDIVDLQTPGGNGHKAYDLSGATTIAYLGSLNNAAGGINDVWPDAVGTPLFVTGSRVGQIVGSWNSAAMNNSYMAGEGTGFIDNSGAITLLTNPQWPDQNYNMGINDVGYAVGFTTGVGFVSYVSANTYTAVYGPNGAQSSYLNAINDDNQAVGSYLVNLGTQDSYSLGMLYQSGGAYLVNPGCPGESDAGTGGETYINGINGFGQMVGYYSSPDGSQMHGFLYSNGTCTTFDIGQYQGFTYPYGINNNGQIVGTYGNVNAYSGFVMDGSVIYSFDYSGPGTTVITAPNSINDAGQLVGDAFLGDGCPPVSCYAAFMYSLVPAQ